MATNWTKPALLQLREIELGGSFEQIAAELTRQGWNDDDIANHFRVSRNTYRNWRRDAGLKLQRELVAA